MAVTALEPVEVDVPPTLALQLDRECPVEQIGAAMEAGFGELMGFAGPHGVELSGPPRAIYTSHGPDGVGFTLAVPVAERLAQEPGGELRVDTLPGGRALRFTHTGPYPRLRATYDRITDWMVEQGRMESEADWERYMPMWEEYVSDPASTPAGELKTFVYLPL